MMKRNLTRIFTLAIACIMLLSLAACSGAPGGNEGMGGGAMGNDAPNGGGAQYVPGGNLGSQVIVPSGGTDNSTVPPEDGGETGLPSEPGDSGDQPPEQSDIRETLFTSVEEQNVSTFSADVDTASYTYFRKLVNSGYSWNELLYFGKAFRTEEFLNYFKYDSTVPAENDLFGVKTTVLPCPWNEKTVLLSMTMQAEVATPAAGNNLVFLIDVSGSMAAIDKLELLKNSFAYLVDNLTERDTVSIVTYSGGERVVLRGCAGNKKETILNAIRSLSASGSTNGEAGLRKAYSIASDYFIEGGNNRIIMASDGDLNVGMSSVAELKSYISNQRKSGIYLSVLGFGTGNYRDANMEALADNGNGIYYYIDGNTEGERVFGTDLLGTLYTVAEDVKLQLTFDSCYVSSYRLIGYENRILDNDDFLDDTKDAGEVGSGHQVTVCYELILTEEALTSNADWMTLAVNYKHPGEQASVPPRLTPIGFANYTDAPSEDAVFQTCLIRLCMLLQRSPHLPPTGELTLPSILEVLNGLDLSGSPERAEFRALVERLVGSDKN